MRTIFLDESGYTGPNLCDPDQPVFTLASVDFTEEECQTIKERYFSDVQARELKYTQLSRNPRQQQMVVNMIAHLRGHQDRTRIAYMHKPFALICKVIDWIVEPSMRREGIDLYDRGGNLAMANMIHFIVMQKGGKEYCDRLYAALQHFMREPSRESFVRTCDVLAEKAAQPCDQADEQDVLGKALTNIYWPLLTLHPDDASCLSSGNLDLALSQALGLMAGWGERHEEMVLVHDASSNMSRQREFWNALVSPDQEDVVVGYDRRTMHYPIGVTETRFEPSEDWAGLQIADVLSGVFRDCIGSQFKEGEPAAFVKDLWEQIDGWPLTDHVSPESKFTPAELGTDGPMVADPMAHVQRIAERAKRNF